MSLNNKNKKSRYGKLFSMLLAASATLASANSWSATSPILTSTNENGAVDALQLSGGDPGSAGIFLDVSRNGEVILFSSQANKLDPAFALIGSNSFADLYTRNLRTGDTVGHD